MAMLVLGIESSCDETSAAIVENGRKVVSNVVSSQEKVHLKYSGVVPELASREHIKNINTIINLITRLLENSITSSVYFLLL